MNLRPYDLWIDELSENDRHIIKLLANECLQKHEVARRAHIHGSTLQRSLVRIAKALNLKVGDVQKTDLVIIRWFLVDLRKDMHLREKAFQAMQLN